MKTNSCSCTPINPKKYSYKEFDNNKKKKFLRHENSPSPPPITFLMVRPLCYERRYGISFIILRATWLTILLSRGNEAASNINVSQQYFAAGIFWKSRFTFYIM